MSINLNGKPLTESLLARLEPLGFCHTGGVPTSNDDTACQAIIDAFTLTTYISERKSEVDTIARNLRDKVIAHVSPGEMATWPIKRAEAIAYQASSNPADAPMLAAEAAVRKADIAQVVQRVLRNAAGYGAIEAHISGVCGAHKDRLSMLNTWEEVRDYDVNAGWSMG